MKINTLRVLLVAASCGFLIGSAEAAIVITEVMSSSAHPAGTNNADWFEFTNSGASAVDLTGWSWDDDTATPGSAHFGSVTSISAGQSIIITGETLGAEASWISNWGLSGVTVVNLGSTEFQSLSATSDQVNIYNASNALVASVTLGAATTGFSFEWDTSGQSLGLSVVGQNGAFQALSNGASAAGVDVGSPGVAVVSAIPEPATYAALAGAGALGLAFWRRRNRAA